jgi:hypothetical protein
LWCDDQLTEDELDLITHFSCLLCCNW